MRSNTECFLGMRNVGDSGDKGRVIRGTLKEQVMNIAKFVGANEMKGRFQFTITRNESDAWMGLRVKGDPTALESELMNELDQLMKDDGNSSTEPEQELNLRVSGDNYIPPHERAKLK